MAKDTSNQDAPTEETVPEAALPTIAANPGLPVDDAPIVNDALTHYSTHLAIEASKVQTQHQALLADLEAAQATIAQVKTEQDNLEALRQEVTNKQVLLTQKEQELADREDKVSQVTAVNQAKEQELATREVQLSDREAQVTDRESAAAQVATDQAAATAAPGDPALTAQQAQIDADLQALREFAQKLDLRDKALEAKKAALLAQEAELLKAEDGTTATE